MEHPVLEISHCCLYNHTECALSAISLIKHEEIKTSYPLVAITCRFFVFLIRNMNVQMTSPIVFSLVLSKYIFPIASLLMKFLRMSLSGSQKPGTGSPNHSFIQLWVGKPQFRASDFLKKIQCRIWWQINALD